MNPVRPCRYFTNRSKGVHNKIKKFDMLYLKKEGLTG